MRRASKVKIADTTSVVRRNAVVSTAFMDNASGVSPFAVVETREQISRASRVVAVIRPASLRLDRVLEVAGTDYCVWREKVVWAANAVRLS